MNRFAILPPLLILGGCVSDPTYVEQDFGNSVRQMVSGQISNPDAAENPDALPVDHLDGVAAEETLDGYRRDARRSGDAKREISLSID